MIGLLKGILSNFTFNTILHKILTIRSPTYLIIQDNLWAVIVFRKRRAECKKGNTLAGAKCLVTKDIL